MVSWEGLPNHEATWEMYEEVQRKYPSLHLEDKVNLEGRSNDRPPIVFSIVEGIRRRFSMSGRIVIKDRL